MEINLDIDKCCGAGQCVFAAPEVFDQREEDGVVVLLEDNPPDDQLAAVREAAAVCPAAVISVRE